MTANGRPATPCEERNWLYPTPSYVEVGERVVRTLTSNRVVPSIGTVDTQQGTVVYRGKSALTPMSADWVLKQIDEPDLRNDPRLDAIRTRGYVSSVLGLFAVATVLPSTVALYVESSGRHPKYPVLPFVGAGVGLIADGIAWLVRPSKDDVRYSIMRDHLFAPPHDQVEVITAGVELINEKTRARCASGELSLPNK